MDSRRAAARADQSQILHVRPVAEGRWEVRADDTPKPISKHSTQYDALTLALVLSRKAGAAVHLHDSGGRVRVLPVRGSIRPQARL